eukprot:s885_g4.t1
MSGQLCRPGWSRYIRESALRTAQDLCPKRPRFRRDLSVVPGESGTMQPKDFQADIAYDVLTQGIGPYCFATVTLSLIRNLSEEDPLNHLNFVSLVYGDANVLTLSIVSILWLLQMRPNAKWRMIIWVILAFWYTYMSVRCIVDPNLIFSEDIWLNHMVFVAFTSLSLGLPRPYVWLLTLVHSVFFVIYTVVNAESPKLQYKPSVGLQVFLVALMAVFTKYSQVLTQVNHSQAEAEVMARICEEEARLAREEANFSAERARMAEAEARAAQAENEAKEAKIKAEMVAQDKDAIEERAKLMECTRGAFQHLLNLLCDAVVELDGYLKLKTPGKLGVLLSHGNGTDLRGRSFQDLVVEHDRERFENWLTSSEHEFPLQVSLLGSYNSKVKVVVYATGFHDLGQTTYFVGITEAEEQLEVLDFRERTRSKESTYMGLEEQLYPGHSITGHWEEAVQEIRSSQMSPPSPPRSPQNAQQKGERRSFSRPKTVAEIEAMEPEDQMQSLLALIWSWPVVGAESSESTCCHTHAMVERAIERLSSLRTLNCSPSPSCLVWQCPSCKLMGLPEESLHFNEVELHCGRCRSWDMLF